jgi:hypothetical protein
LLAAAAGEMARADMINSKRYPSWMPYVSNHLPLAKSMRYAETLIGNPSYALENSVVATKNGV